MATASSETVEPVPASKNEGMRVKQRRPVLRGYIRQAPDGSYQGMCLTLNLAARGRSLEDTEKKLFALIVAYLTDAQESGTWRALVPRRAPLSYYMTYFRLRIFSPFRSLMDFKLFVQSAPDCPAHA